MIVVFSVLVISKYSIHKYYESVTKELFDFDARDFSSLSKFKLKIDKDK